jgi:hypothetical protein
MENTAQTSIPAPRVLQKSPYRVASEVGLPSSVPSRRLEDRIRELCARALSASGAELEPLISELQAALREHNSRLRKLAADKLANFPMRFRKRPVHNT